MNLTKLELDGIRAVGNVPYKGTKEKNCECVVREKLFLVCAVLVKTKKWDRKRYSHLTFPAAGESKCYIAELKRKLAKPETEQQLYKVLETHQEGNCCSRFGTWMFWSTKGKSQHIICSTPMVWMWFQIKVSIYLCHHTSCAFVEIVARTRFLNFVMSCFHLFEWKYCCGNYLTMSDFCPLLKYMGLAKQKRLKLSK